MGKRGDLKAVPPPSRVVGGNCDWHDSPQFVSDFDELRRFDQFGAMALLELKDAARTSRGLSKHKPGLDYRVPLRPPGRGIKVVDPPWMGELKVQGKRVAKSLPIVWEHRLYFGEPVERPRLCVALGASKKDPRDPRANAAQGKQISTMMQYLKRYLGELGYTWEAFGK